MVVCVAPFEFGANLMYHRKTVVLAEAIYTHWLYAIWKKGLESEYDFLPVCPWRPERLPYIGCCRFSPLTFPIPGNSITGLSKDERRLQNNIEGVNRRKHRTPLGKLREKIRRRYMYGFGCLKKMEIKPAPTEKQA